MNAAIKNELNNFLVEAERIPENAFNAFYFFYQKNIALLYQLDYEVYFQIKVRYLKVLHSLEDFSLFHEESELFLSELLNVNEFNENYKKHYKNILYLKAEAYLNEGKTECAKRIYHELAQLDPDNKFIYRKLFKLHFETEFYNNQKKLKWIIGFLLAFLLLNAGLIFFIYPFYPEYEAAASVVRDGFFVLSLILFLGFQGLNGFAARNAIQIKMRQMKLKKMDFPLQTRC